MRIRFKKMLLLIGILLLAVAGYYFYPEKKLPRQSRIDQIEVYKSKRKMLVYSNGELLKTYTISLGKNPIGSKECEGDCKTPEGTYTIDARNPNSGYHKNLGVSYPEEKDVAVSRQLGKPTGGNIKIHGLRNGAGYIGKFHRWTDWTAGCIAVTNAEIDELYEAVIPNTTITIHP